MHPNTEELQTVDLPLKKLLAWEDNVRTTAPEKGIEELAASITSLELLQSLVVKKASRGKHTVVAGKRRLLALSRLADAGTLPAGFPVPCRLLATDADSTEISLAENVQREPMHPADEFEAFRKLIENGKTVADVAARFGVSEAVVNKRLVLARVPPHPSGLRRNSRSMWLPAYGTSGRGRHYYSIDEPVALQCGAVGILIVISKNTNHEDLTG